MSMSKDDLAHVVQSIRLSERVELKAPIRAKLQADIQKYLSEGKEIKQLPSNARSLDPKLMNW